MRRGEAQRTDNRRFDESTDELMHIQFIYSLFFKEIFILLILTSFFYYFVVIHGQIAPDPLLVSTKITITKNKQTERDKNRESGRRKTK